MRSRELHCTICEADMLFETPPCADGHGPDCDEMMCTGCRNAIFVPPILVGPAGQARGRHRVPAQRRRAA